MVGDSVSVGDLKGLFGINNCTINRNSMNIQGLSEDLVLDVKNQRVTLVYTGSTDGWVITELEPNNSQFEYMPYAVMHVQERYPQNTSTITPTANSNIRLLNTVRQNDISGATLSNNAVTLPAGTYDFDGYTNAKNLNESGRVNIVDSAGVVLIAGLSTRFFGSGDPRVVGQLTFAAQTTIKMELYLSPFQSEAATLGKPVNQPGVDEVYADLKITKIGGNYAPKPVISQARLSPMAGVVPNCQVQGFEITNTGTNQITVTKGQCLDSGLTTPIAVTGSTILTPIAGNNALSTIAAVILNDGTHTCKVYASEAAMASDVGVNITHFAYLGFWQNNGSGQAKAGRLMGTSDGQAELWWGKASENAVNSLQTVPVNCSTSIPLASYLPSSDRVAGVIMRANGATGDQTVVYGVDGTNTVLTNMSSYQNTGDTEHYTWGYSSSPSFIPILNNTVYWGRGSAGTGGTHKALLQAVRIRR
jgi:hypothetical protein